MTKEELLNEKCIIYTIALDRIWDKLTDEDKIRIDPIYDDMEKELDKLQSSEAVKTLEKIFKDWGDDISKRK